MTVWMVMLAAATAASPEYGAIRHDALVHRAPGAPLDGLVWPPGDPWIVQLERREADGWWVRTVRGDDHCHHVLDLGVDLAFWVDDADVLSVLAEDHEQGGVQLQAGIAVDPVGAGRVRVVSDGVEIELSLPPSKLAPSYTTLPELLPGPAPFRRSWSTTMQTVLSSEAITVRLDRILLDTETPERQQRRCATVAVPPWDREAPASQEVPKRYGGAGVGPDRYRGGRIPSGRTVYWEGTDEVAGTTVRPATLHGWPCGLLDHGVGPVCAEPGVWRTDAIEVGAGAVTLLDPIAPIHLEARENATCQMQVHVGDDGQTEAVHAHRTCTRPLVRRAADLLEGRRWTVHEVAGRPVPVLAPIALTFGPDASPYVPPAVPLVGSIDPDRSYQGAAGPRWGWAPDTVPSVLRPGYRPGIAPAYPDAARKAGLGARRCVVEVTFVDVDPERRPGAYGAEGRVDDVAALDCPDLLFDTARTAVSEADWPRLERYPVRFVLPILFDPLAEPMDGPSLPKPPYRGERVVVPYVHAYTEDAAAGRPAYPDDVDPVEVGAVACLTRVTVRADGSTMTVDPLDCPEAFHDAARAALRPVFWERLRRDRRPEPYAVLWDLVFDPSIPPM
jgi:hypothetical protein